MMCYTLHATVRRIRGKLITGSKDVRVTGVSTDSRQVKPGHLFFAIPGDRTDGHQYVRQAFENGASAVVIQRRLPDLTVPDGCGVIAVRNTRKALGDMAAMHRLRHPGIWFAVTGSVGKTTTKELMAHAMASRGDCILKAEKSFNNDIGVPITVLKADRRHDAHVLEIGTNAPGEIDVLASICRPNIAAITGAGPVHLEGLGDINGVAKEKGAILKRLFSDDIAILNLDDPYYSYWSRLTDARIVTVSASGNPAADFFASDVSSNVQSSAFTLNGQLPVRVPLAGVHHVRNVLIAVAAANAAGMAVDDIARAMKTVPALPGRAAVHALPNGGILVDDSYNASPVSFIAALDHFRLAAAPGEKIVVAGDMLELGAVGEYWHRELGWKIAAVANRLVAVGRFADHIAAGAMENGLPAGRITVFPDVQSAREYVLEMTVPPVAILLKGSHRIQLGQLVTAILERAAVWNAIAA